LLLPLIAGCQTPFLVFPGEALQGMVEQTKSRYSLMQLETCAPKPYSVFLRVTVIEESLYIDASPKRRWAKYLVASPKVRVRLGKLIYPAIAVLIDNPSISERFISGRQIYELVPSADMHSCR
jgi:hypothetical protein